MSNSSIWPIDRTLSDATIPGYSWQYSNEWVLCIPQSSSITGALTLDCLISYLGHSLGGGGLTPLQRCRQCILQPQPTSLSYSISVYICLSNFFLKDNGYVLWFKKIYQTYLPNYQTSTDIDTFYLYEIFCLIFIMLRLLIFWSSAGGLALILSDFLLIDIDLLNVSLRKFCLS